MCGINGIISLIKDKQERLLRMNQTLQHRGPEDEGSYINENVALGHRRLMIIDLSLAGHQPMTTPDGRYTMVFNGEIYNYQEIKKELDYSFKSTTDSEVILAAWQKWGADCVQRFNGMFAIAMWDHWEQQLTLVRDRLGIKPIYWHCKNSQLVFSSEIRALLASGIAEKRIDQDGLVDYLRYQTVQAPATILKDVYMLKAGHLLIYKAGDQPVVKEYWRPQIKPQANVVSYEQVKEEVRELFFKSVQRRLIADVPFGAFLSGGIDSSAIVGAMTKVSNAPVKTFNISFAEEAFSEAKYARYIAQLNGTDHTEIKLSPNDLLNCLPVALKGMDHPSGDGPNTWLVSKVTKEAGVTMALSGLGGDELFAGYAIFKRMLALHSKQWLWKMPNAIRKGMGELLCKVKPGVASTKMKALLSMPDYQFAKVFSVSRQSLMDEQLKDLLSRDGLPEHQPAFYLQDLISHVSQHVLSNVSIGELCTYMQNVLLRDSDQMSMAHALEVRVPFLDHELVEYMLSLPDPIKYPATPKKLMVDSMPDLLPDYIVNRPKMGFTFPWRHWLKNELNSFADERLRSLAKRDYFNEASVLSLWQRFKKDDPVVTFSRIWPLVVLEEWMNNE
ncbi:asparagine synthase (glutamine-hydrolyzing) [Carboxylicivirga mesophila]|uniref:asparagine synthase (glutamine-hydrolyzing) n=1 Tax=Carboxylicivirga mesophila TaxID=1166478 RepID=A0ABS5KCQ1_9BACT|nr:asparagine synthase (glutamine-hydrolyzing) [Carboxylicivirga mesophila]MBS2212118.1 asparagine synthase (glutamine-hydrolyzing) [Carboxylicivirga mesophila]